MTLEIDKPTLDEAMKRVRARGGQLETQMLEDMAKGLLQAASLERERLGGIKEAYLILSKMAEGTG